jgi:hypothetical protein
MPSITVAWQLLLLAAGSMALCVWYEGRVQRMWSTGERLLAPVRSKYVMGVGVLVAAIGLHCAWALILLLLD